MGTDLEAKGCGRVEEGGGGMGKMDPNGSKFTAPGIGFAEVIEAAPEFGGIRCRHLRAPGAVVLRNGAGGGEQVGQRFFVGAVSRIEM